ncbi:hypothetical protein [Streptosporangium sp. KLBMP 9127]|nr:hypothetical protein [Streptosporangium sp. KLBMP 9127]
MTDPMDGYEPYIDPDDHRLDVLCPVVLDRPALRVHFDVDLPQRVVRVDLVVHAGGRRPG